MEDFIFKYHRNLAEHFKAQNKTWNWFANAKVQAEQLKEHKQDILKNTYRLSPDTEKDIYDLAKKAKEKLNISKEITLYQEMDTLGANARVSFFGNEIHIVLSGELLQGLEKNELLAIIGHELSHVLFYEANQGIFEITSRIINSIANDTRSEEVMVETARLYRLYMELFCDRGALKVVGNVHTVIEAMVKVSTGLTRVSAINYLKQAKEILEEDYIGSAQQTHPETFIRVLALEYFNQEKLNSYIENLIDSQWSMNKLDLFKQAQLNQETLKMLHIICKPKWMRTEVNHSLCRQFYPNFNFNDEVHIDTKLTELFENVDDSVREYFCYILLDFCFSDNSLEAAPIGHALQISEELQFNKTFKKILKREMRSSARDLDNLINKGVTEVSELNESAEESILNDE